MRSTKEEGRRKKQQAAGSGQPAVGRVGARKPQIPKAPNPSSLPAARCPLPAAFTLIELLVVISIMMLLAAYVLPRLQPAAEGRRLREAARMTNVFLSRARARAFETGRPCGVLFRPLENPIILPGGSEVYTASNLLYQVEVPPPYAGQSTDSRVRVQTSGGTLVVTATVSGDFPSSPMTIVNSGDLIQLNNQGPWYQIAAVGDDTLTLSVDPSLLNPIYRLPWPAVPSWSNPVPFTILRQPAPTIAAPLRLPTDTVVDFAASGTSQDPDRFAQGGQSPVTILFSPGGSVHRCYWNDSSDAQDAVPTEPLFLLIGRESRVGLGPPRYDGSLPGTAPEQLLNAPDDEKPNWQLPDNFWITISPQTGLVSTSESKEPTDWYANPKQTLLPNMRPKPRDGINEARQFAKQSRSMGGR